MSQQVIIDRDLEFRGAALFQPNVKGPLMTEYKIFDECFFADADEHDWTETTNGCTVAHSSVDGGATTITGDNTATDDCAELSHTAQWSPYWGCGVEIKAKISQITNVCVCVGFVNAIENLNDHVAIEMSGSALRGTTTTTDFVGMVFDTDATASVWYYGASESGTEGTPVAAAGSIAPVADTYFKVRVQTDVDGNCTFYYGAGNSNNLVAVGYLPEAIASAVTSLLTPYVGFITRAKGAQICTVPRITTWQAN